MACNTNSTHRVAHQSHGAHPSSPHDMTHGTTAISMYLNAMCIHHLQKLRPALCMLAIMPHQPHALGCAFEGKVATQLLVKTTHDTNKNCHNAAHTYYVFVQADMQPAASQEKWQPAEGRLKTGATASHTLWPTSKLPLAKAFTARNASGDIKLQLTNHTLSPRI